MAGEAGKPGAFINFLKDMLALVGTLTAVAAILLNFQNTALNGYLDVLPFHLPVVSKADANTLFMWGTTCLSIGLGSKTDGLLKLASIFAPGG